MDIYEIQSRLKFISSVQIGDKINVKFMTLQKDCLSTKISRTVYYENRQTGYNFIKDTVNRALEIISPPEVLNKNKDIIEGLIVDLTKCKQGIQNLKETYVSDIKFCCDLDTILEKIKLNIADHEKLNNANKNSNQNSSEGFFLENGNSNKDIL